MLKVLRLAPWMMAAILAALQVGPAGAQGNIDAGKTPAQIFGDTCSACHRSARELRRASAGFLRTHYTAGADEAAAMANYLTSVANDPGAAQPKRPPADVAKQNPRSPAAEQAKSAAPGQAKGRSNAAAQATAQPAAAPTPPPEEKPPEAPARPAVEPFEE